MSYKFEVTIPIELSANDIDDIMVTATEGGVNYWCAGLKTIEEGTLPIDGYTGNEKEYILEHFVDMKHCSKVLLSGGGILFEDMEGDEQGDEEKYTLTLEKLLSGIKLYMVKGISEPDHRVLDLENYDANDADIIIQYALFGELVYG